MQNRDGSDMFRPRKLDFRCVYTYIYTYVCMPPWSDDNFKYLPVPSYNNDLKYFCFARKKESIIYYIILFSGIRLRVKRFSDKIFTYP